VSTESIASTTPAASTAPAIGAPETCPRCHALLAEDQRYCLECGERRTPPSSVLLGGVPPASPAAPPGTPPSPAGSRSGDGDRSNAVTVIAGVGVLLLALGVGVLIGRSGASKSGASPPPQVITLSAAPSSGATSGAAANAGEASAFSDDWSAGKSGYTVQLQTLTQSSTKTSEVEAAKSAASAKGAKDVGALESEHFSSLTPGDYVIYSGIYAKRAQAQKALAGLKQSFPAASVLKVSGGGAGSSSSSAPSSGAGASHSSSGAGSSESHPASPKVLEEEHKSKGKSYEEKSKNLPDVVGT
jgi:hypothetical protein